MKIKNKEIIKNINKENENMSEAYITIEFKNSGITSNKKYLNNNITLGLSNYDVNLIEHLYNIYKNKYDKNDAFLKAIGETINENIE